MKAKSLVRLLGNRPRSGRPAGTDGTADEAGQTGAFEPPAELPLTLFAERDDPAENQLLCAAAFGHGYLLHGPGPPAALPGFLASWRTERIGALTARLAPRTVLAMSLREGLGVALLGHPIDVDHGTAAPQEIADRLCNELAARGADAAVAQAAYLAGRWTMILVNPGAGSDPGDGAEPDEAGTRCTLVPDTMASQPIYYASDSDSFTAASSEVLVAVARGLAVSQGTLALRSQIRELRPKGTIYLPGTRTDFDGVLPVLPNCLIRVDLRAPGTVSHQRFWPLAERTEEASLEVVYDRFRDRMAAQLRLTSELGPMAWSLTGGLDSRVSLAMRPAGVDAFTFTWLNPQDAVTDPAAVDDVFAANQVAFQAGLAHRVLRWRRAPSGSVFEQIYRSTFPTFYYSHGAAYAMWEDLPSDLIQIQSNGGEIGTRNSRRRSDAPLDAAKAAALWLGPKFAGLPTYRDIWDEYLSYVQISDDRLAGYDHHDVMYWEVRMGRWGHQRFMAGDFSHRIMLPYNDRRVLEIMHQLPEEPRISKELYRMVLEQAPALQLPGG